jgi:hypothetical protein
MEDDNKNIDSETESTPTKLETETETELFGSFNSMNETTDEESNKVKNLLLAIGIGIVMVFGSAVYKYMTRH